MRIFANSLRACRFATSTAEPVGEVYTWSNNKISKVELPEKARRVALGQNHSAIIGESGNLYTYGSNKHGQLGHGTQAESKAPKLVEYFNKKNIKVKEALCGENHTIALSEDGQVYTFGHGGKQTSFFSSLFLSKASPLGHGNQLSVLEPTRVKFFEGKKIERITAGNLFNFAIEEKGKVYYWGCGEYGVAGDGATKNCSVPSQNEYFQYLEEEEKTKIKKLKSCGSFSIALMDNGLLYGWGSNHAGQIGIKNEIGAEMHEMVNYPHLVIRDGYENEKVKNFDCSENLTIFELENKELWWCGKSFMYKPDRIRFDEESEGAKLFAAGSRSFVIISKENNIYSYNGFIEKKGGDENVKTGIIKLKGSEVFSGEIVGIGGEYNTRYAIVA